MKVLGHIFVGSLFLITYPLQAKETLEQIKISAAARSKYLSKSPTPNTKNTPKADLEGFHTKIQPILNNSCVECHGPKKQKAKFRIDTLDPDLVNGDDADWWLEVIDVLSNGEMPPPDEDVVISDKNRGMLIDWLSSQALAASQAKRSKGGHSSFRRMTKYEFNYALQDLLKLPQDFALDLPPETASEDGFQNSSEMLQLTSQQFATYQSIARKALQSAIVPGPPPKPAYFSITMEKGGEYYMDWATKHYKYHRELKERIPNDSDIPGRFEKALDQAKEHRVSLNRTHFLNKETGEAWNRRVPNGFSLWEPTDQKPVDPEVQPFAIVIPHGERQSFDLGTSLPDRGTVKIRFRANRATMEGDSYPSLALSFGHNPNNNSSRSFPISKKDIAITAPPNEPQFYEWLIELDGIQRNPYLRTGTLGTRPSPNEIITFKNVHQGNKHDGATVHIDYVEIIAPHITQWPPASHLQIFPEQALSGNDENDAHKVLKHFMPKAWRRSVTEKEINRKLNLFKRIRPTCNNFQEAIVEVLAAVLSSPHFFYLTQTYETTTPDELASRLSFFLWSSQPDEKLLSAASNGNLQERGNLTKQAERMLADPRSSRFTQHFTSQWLGMELLDTLKVDKKIYPNFSNTLKYSMKQEPVEFFKYVLKENRSIMDFLHADYSLLNQTLATHYGITKVHGNHFRKVNIAPESKRGGVLTQAGLLAMNSDGKDSHPLKRGIWLLENLLHDPPPPPPPAVPEIDLTDPEILKMTLKERMEDHRNDPACSSCHSKIDPWGIAFENFDAIGSWRETVDGKPVDSTSYLYQKSELAGMFGLKSYLLQNRQDQFARAMVHKLASYALGRPLTFSDRAEVEQITKQLRQEGDGLQTLIFLLIESDLFKNT